MQIQYIFSHREKGILSISITAAGRKESKESGDLSPAPPGTCSADTQAGGEGPRLASNSLSLQQTARCSTYRPSQENVSGSGRCLCRAVCRAVGRPSPASLPRGRGCGSLPRDRSLYAPSAACSAPVSGAQHPALPLPSRWKPDNQFCKHMAKAPGCSAPKEILLAGKASRVSISPHSITEGEPAAAPSPWMTDETPPPFLRLETVTSVGSSEKLLLKTGSD